MFEALVAFFPAAQPTVLPPAASEPYVECTAARLRPFVGPLGIHQSWPVAAALPEDLAQQLGHPLSDQGNVEDGYSHWLLVSSSRREAFVVQRGGFAGLQKVYGPLPVAVCAPVP
jgi:hypothetical protein